MKVLAIAMTISLLMIFPLIAQEETEITTTVLKAENLITYAADNYPQQNAQQIYLLVETGVSGISQESKFFVEKGVELLLKRLKTGDEIAIGTYGSTNGILIPYTDVTKEELITQQVQALLKSTFNSQNGDGMDIAYNLAESNQTATKESTVLMLRDTGLSTVSAPPSATNSFVATENLSGIDTINTPATRKELRAQRKQAKAAEQTTIGGAIALTALTILPEILDIIKD